MVCGTRRDRIVAEVERLVTDDPHYRRMASAKNPYGDGDAARLIVDALENEASFEPVLAKAQSWLTRYNGDLSGVTPKIEALGEGLGVRATFVSRAAGVVRETVIDRSTHASAMLIGLTPCRRASSNARRRRVKLAGLW